MQPEIQLGLSISTVLAAMTGAPLSQAINPWWLATAVPLVAALASFAALCLTSKRNPRPKPKPNKPTQPAIILTLATPLQAYALWLLHSAINTNPHAPNNLAFLLVLTTTLISLLVAVYALFYFPKHARNLAKPAQPSHFWPLFWLLQAALNTVWLSASLLTAYLALELLTLIAINLVILDRQPQSLVAGRRYLYTALCSSVLLVAGLITLYWNYGTLNFANLSTLLDPTWTTQFALLSITIGLVVKTAIVPFHRWLPQAHGVALVPVSALHAALVTKASFYILARLWLDTGHGLLHIGVAQGLGALGALSIAYGGYQALQQRNVKMLIAYSTVAQLGYLLLLFPLATGAHPSAAAAAWQGSMLHLIAHAFAKAAIFLSIGTLVASLGSKQLRALTGTSMHMPVSLMAFGLASVSLMGLPPSGGFNAKWLLLQSALHSGQWHWVAVLLGGSLLTASYIFKLFSLSFLQRPSVQLRPNLQRPSSQRSYPHHHTPAALGLELTALTLASIAILLGFIAAVPDALLTTAPNPTAAVLEHTLHPDALPSTSREVLP